MRIRIVAVGRQKGGPEAALTQDYLARFDAAGRTLGLGPAAVTEVEDRKRVGESRLLLEAAPKDAWLVALDERGRTMSSRGFATLLAAKRDEGRREAAFLIGGADGHDDALRGRADLLLSFGEMVWPHMLARAMLAEQLYRAASILAGAPYHRD
ncbi:MAG: 23S rRNA (pseudouridine(1915)-N(3))-methyltransferase RlmH [Pseudomonadota bacterium]